MRENPEYPRLDYFLSILLFLAEISLIAFRQYRPKSSFATASSPAELFFRGAFRIGWPKHMHTIISSIKAVAVVASVFLLGNPPPVLRIPLLSSVTLFLGFRGPKTGDVIMIWITTLISLTMFSTIMQTERPVTLAAIPLQFATLIPVSTFPLLNKPFVHLKSWAPRILFIAIFISWILLIIFEQLVRSSVDLYRTENLRLYGTIFLATLTLFQETPTLENTMSVWKRHINILVEEKRNRQLPVETLKYYFLFTCLGLGSLDQIVSAVESRYPKGIVAVDSDFHFLLSVLMTVLSFHAVFVVSYFTSIFYTYKLHSNNGMPLNEYATSVLVLSGTAALLNLEVWRWRNRLFVMLALGIFLISTTLEPLMQLAFFSEKIIDVIEIGSLPQPNSAFVLIYSSQSEQYESVEFLADLEPGIKSFSVWNVFKESPERIHRSRMVVNNAYLWLPLKAIGGTASLGCYYAPEEKYIHVRLPFYTNCDEFSGDVDGILTFTTSAFNLTEISNGGMKFYRNVVEGTARISGLVEKSNFVWADVLSVNISKVEKFDDFLLDSTNLGSAYENPNTRLSFSFAPTTTVNRYRTLYFPNRMLFHFVLYILIGTGILCLPVVLVIGYPNLISPFAMADAMRVIKQPNPYQFEHPEELNVVIHSKDESFWTINPKHRVQFAGITTKKSPCESQEGIHNPDYDNTLSH